MIAANPPDDNQWFRNQPDGKQFFHAAGDAEFVIYCSAATLAANACNPFSGEAFIGFGKVKLNTRSADQVFSCPFTVRIKGSASDGFGNVVDLVAASTSVPDPDRCDNDRPNALDRPVVLFQIATQAC